MTLVSVSASNQSWQSIILCYGGESVYYLVAGGSSLLPSGTINESRERRANATTGKEEFVCGLVRLQLLRVCEAIVSTTRCVPSQLYNDACNGNRVSRVQGINSTLYCPRAHRGTVPLSLKSLLLAPTENAIVPLGLAHP